MLIQFWSSVHVYLLMLALMPFGLVGIPQGIGILRGNVGFGMLFYVVLFVNPVLYRFYLQQVLKKMQKKGLVRSRKDKWIRGILWTFASHFVVYEIIYFSLPGMETGMPFSEQLILMALSAIAFLFLAASTSYVTYRLQSGQKQFRFFR